jgi:hypothetical protein
MRLKTLILEKCAKRNNADGGDKAALPPADGAAGKFELLKKPL